jgi:phosphopantetheine--protein transferase-like protein
MVKSIVRLYQNWRIMQMTIDRCHLFSEALSLLFSSLSKDVVACLLIRGKSLAKIGSEGILLRRAVLRRLLSYLTNVPEASLPLFVMPNGKPVSPLLFFNHSNKNDGWLYAFSQETEIGIDLESIRNKIGIKDIVRLFFSREEQISYDRASPPEKQNYFFRLWTIKEAIAKCFGIPLDIALKEPIKGYFHSFSLENHQIAIVTAKEVPKVRMVVLDLLEREPIHEVFGI